MTTIVPRWEWRTFGSRFGAAETRFAELQPTGVQESDEVYLLAGSDNNVKIRDALMDIKVLREVESTLVELDTQPSDPMDELAARRGAKTRKIS